MSCEVALFDLAGGDKAQAACLCQLGMAAGRPCSQILAAISSGGAVTVAAAGQGSP